MRAAELGSERPLIAARARERESLFRKLLPSRQHSPCTDYVSKRKQAALSVPEKRLEKKELLRGSVAAGLKKRVKQLQNYLLLLTWQLAHGQ